MNRIWDEIGNFCIRFSNPSKSRKSWRGEIHGQAVSPRRWTSEDEFTLVVSQHHSKSLRLHLNSFDRILAMIDYSPGNRDG